MSTYNDLVGKYIFARLRDGNLFEWQQCKVTELVDSGLKVQSRRTHEVFIIANNDVCEDVRLANAFLPYEHDQKPYDGNFFFVIV